MTIRFVPGPANNGYEWAFCEGERERIYLVYCLNVCVCVGTGIERSYLKMEFLKLIVLEKRAPNSTHYCLVRFWLK